MIDLEPEIRAEYERVISLLKDDNEIIFPGHLSTADIIRAHFLIANHFYLVGEGLGGIGPREVNLLKSAIGRQGVSFDGRLKWTDRFDICATLFFGLIKNHAFHDANKRTAFLSALYFLHQHGWCPSVPEKEFENLTVEIADNLLGRYARYAKMLKDGEADPEVKFISWYLPNHTRRIDKQYYAVTYRELQTILHRYGFGLSNPRGNHIDIVKVRQRPRFLGILGKAEIVEERIGQIGFPRWTSEVGRSAIKTVREVTGLTHERGVDSAAIFQGLDPIQTLITTYHEPLMSLAGR
jgi:prophage maintenance system killer protein